MAIAYQSPVMMQKGILRNIADTIQAYTRVDRNLMCWLLAMGAITRTDFSWDDVITVMTRRSALCYRFQGLLAILSCVGLTVGALILFMVKPAIANDQCDVFPPSVPLNATYLDVFPPATAANNNPANLDGDEESESVIVIGHLPNRPYVVVVPGRQDALLQEVRHYVSDAFVTTSRLGDYIHTGAFGSRREAELLARRLRNCDIRGARVVYFRDGRPL